MKPYEVIQKINQAMCDDDLEAAEKVLEDYVVDFEMYRIKKAWNDFIMLRDVNNLHDPKKLYQSFINK